MIHYLSADLRLTIKGRINRYFHAKIEPLNWQIKWMRYSIYDHVDYMTHRISFGPFKFDTGKNKPVEER